MAIGINNHIHLSLTLSDVTSNVAAATWAINLEGYNPQPTVYLSTVRTFGGKMQVYAAKTTGGVVVLSENAGISLRLRAAHSETIFQRVDRLKNMLGKQVYFLPPTHDSASHATGVKTMLLREIGNWRGLDPALANQEVQIFLEDINP